MFHKFLHYSNPFLMVHVNNTWPLLFWTAAALVVGTMVLLTIRTFHNGTNS